MMNREISVINSEHKHKITEYMKVVSFAFITPATDSEQQMEKICDLVERYYTSFGCEWKSENVVSGSLEIPSAKEYIIIGTTPINKQKIVLAKIKHTTNYYSHKLNIKDGNGYEAHIIFVNLINCNSLYPFVVELYEMNYFA